MPRLAKEVGLVGRQQIDGELALEFQNSDRLSAGVTANYERVTRTFPLTATAGVVPGIYSFTTTRAAYTVGQQRRELAWIDMALLALEHPMRLAGAQQARSEEAHQVRQVEVRVAQFLVHLLAQFLKADGSHRFATHALASGRTLFRAKFRL